MKNINVRLMLYMLAGVLIFALWDAWQKDYPPPKPVEQQTVQTQVQAGSSSSSGASGFVSATTTPATASTNKNNLVNATSNIAAPKSRLVTVHTDVLEVGIDTVGGNLVSATLPEYPAELHSALSVQLFDSSPDKLYLAQTGVLGAGGPDESGKLAQYKAAQKYYALAANQQNLQVKLVWNGSNGLSVDKIYTFTKGSYAVKINYVVHNATSAAWNGKFYAQFVRKNPQEVGKKLQYNTFAGVAVSTPDKPYAKFTYKKLAQENIDTVAQGGWLALQQHYFLSAWVPDKSKTYHYFSSSAPGEIYTAGLEDNAFSVPAHGETSVAATLYSGPDVAAYLSAVTPKLDLAVDYGWLWIISVMLFWLLKNIYRLVGNWGLSIIFLTILIKLAFFKLSETSYRSMARMKDLAPRMQELKERFGDDRQKLSQATMEMYRKEKINPLGGCLPMLVQIPFFIGLYYMLISAVELRQAPFFFWIHDLSAKDPLYILPILMGLSMLIQQKLSPQSPDPAQAKMMLILPVVFTVFFLQFPSGLVLYWLVNNCVSVLQQWYINRKVTGSKTSGGLAIAGSGSTKKAKKK